MGGLNEPESAHERAALERRVRAVNLVEQGRTQAQAGEIVGLHRHTVARVVRRHASGGPGALASRKPGRKPRLSEEQEAAMAELVRTNSPDELGLRGRFWTRDATVELLARELGVRVSKERASKYLNTWGAERLRGRPPQISDEA